MKCVHVNLLKAERTLMNEQTQANDRNENEYGGETRLRWKLLQPSQCMAALFQ